MLVRRLPLPDACRVAYVVACPVTRVAALVDGEQLEAEQVASVLDGSGLRLGMLLSTRLVREGAGDGLDDLLDELTRLFTDAPAACRDDALLASELRPAFAEDAVWVRPAPGWDAEDRGGVVVRIDGVTVELCACARDGRLEAYDHASPHRGGFAVCFGSARLSLGQTRVEVLPLRDRRNAVAYRVGGHLFTGQALHTEAPPTALDCTDDALLALSERLIVQPGVTRGARRVATIAQERVWRASRRSGTLGTDPLGTCDARGAIGRRVADGYVDAEPAAVLASLLDFRVLDVRLDHELEPSIAGAEAVHPRAVLEAARSTAQDTLLLLVSPAGGRCAHAARTLARAGFSRVHRLVGGLWMWRESGLPVEPLGSSDATAQRRR